MQKVILITGASSGMGKVTAEDLIKKGHIVYCAARKVEEMADLEELGGKVVRMDVTKEEDLQAVVEQILEEEKCIDVLWNNAGFGLYGPVEEIPMEKVRYQFEVNLFGLGRLTQLVLPQMRKQKSGTIINTSSMGGKMYTPLGSWYHATKHALEGFSDCLRLELKEFDIDVVLLEPGLIDTGFLAGVEQNFPQESQEGPYSRIVKGLMGGALAETKGSDPKVISETVQKIIESDRPKTRYVAGKMARSLMWVRKYLGDRVFDKLILSRIK